MLSLGIDIGTSGVRTAVLSDTGQLVSMTSVPHLPQDPAKIDADLWWDAVRQCMQSQMLALRGEGVDPLDIKYICVDGTSGSLVLTDRALTPVSRALMYDAGGFTEEADLIADVSPEKHITRGSNSALARALRLLNEAGSADHLLHQADFIAAKLIGHGGQSDVMNALKTGVDPETGNWPDWMQAALPMALLPVAHPLGTPMGDLSTNLAQEFGLRTDVQILAGTTDSIAAFLAAAPMKPGVAVTSLGSTLAIKMLCTDRVENTAQGLYSHRVGNAWLVGGASNTGGKVLRHFFSDDDLARLSKMIDPTSPIDLDYYPLITPGERFPVNDPDFQPKLTPRPSNDADFLHGLFDGIARIEAMCYAILETAGGSKPTTIFSAGGGAQNPIFTQIRAGHLGLLPQAATQSEAAIGAAKIPFLK